ncbi:MAG: HAMP domain-containing histidine kinase [Calditrichaeota bacterium]|nr:HAMP domain-containing histidine kinase [Calditrichota bacterium]
MIKWKPVLKQLFFVVGICVPLASIFVFRNVINDLELEAKKQLNFQVEVFQSFIRSKNQEDVTFVFTKLIENTTYPVIYTDQDFNPVNWVNVTISDSSKQDAELQAYITKFKDFNDPIPVTYEEQTLGYYCYGEPLYLTQLRWLPVIVFSAILVLIIVAYYGFVTIKRDEEKNIWVGLAKETAHQLGTPISSIAGWVEVLKDNPKSLDSSLPEFEKDIQRLNMVLNRFSKIGSKAEFSRFDLNDIISDVVDYFQKRLPKYEKEIKISFEHGEAVFVLVNRELIVWVLENLMRNSIDAIKSAKGKIEIKLLRKKQSVAVLFSDNGTGISGKFHKKIFSPGFTTKRRGWGLGLSLAKRIIENYHNGHIYVESSSEGNGTTFHIELRTA